MPVIAILSCEIGLHLIAVINFERLSAHLEPIERPNSLASLLHAIVRYEAMFGYNCDLEHISKPPEHSAEVRHSGVFGNVTHIDRENFH